MYRNFFISQYIIFYICISTSLYFMLNYFWSQSKERKEKGTVSLMRRLTSMKRSKSPPPLSYSMDNPVFEDATLGVAKSSPAHPVHVRYVLVKGFLHEFQHCQFTLRIIYRLCLMFAILICYLKKIFEKFIYALHCFGKCLLYILFPSQFLYYF